jgi:hypothetical protein
MMRTLIVFIPRPDAEQDPLRAVLRRMGHPPSWGVLEDHGAFLIGCVVMTAVACVATWLHYKTRADARWVNGRHARPARKAVRS